MKKVVFVEPQAGANLAYGDFLKKWPLLGCLTMATMLNQRGHDVKVYSENLTGSVLDDDKSFAELMDSHFVGVTALTASVGRAYEIAQRLKRNGFNGRLVIGGPHVSFLPDEALQYFPCVVCGEGETVIIPLVEGGERPEGIIAARPVGDLDTLPTPDLSLIHRSDQLWKTCLWKENYEVPLATSRGCPHDCKYCTVTQMYGRRCRMRSVDKVFQDVMFYYDRGYRAFFFYDDNFAADRSRTRRLLEMIKPLGIRWDAQARIDFPWIDPASRSTVDERLMGAVGDSGVNVIYVGYETIDDNTATEWNKGYKGAGPLVQRMEEDTRILHDHGVWVHGMFVIGPHHDLATYEAIVDFSNRNGIDSIQISVLTPFPGTQIMTEMQDDLIFTDYPDDWKYYDGAHLTFHHKKAGNKAIHEAMVKYHKQYYNGSIHQWDRLRRFVFGPGAMYKKLLVGVKSALRVRRLMKRWEAETAEFIDTTATRGSHYLYPARQDPAKPLRAHRAGI